MIKKCKGFTLVELLAVIAVLGLLLIIAVPKISNVMENSKKKTLVLTAKSIARSAEEKKIENETFGIEEKIICDSVSEYSKDDFNSCSISFDDDGKASVTLAGKGQYKGLYVCNGNKITAEVTTESCSIAVSPTNFEDDDWSTIIEAVRSGNHPYEVGNSKTIILGNNLGTHRVRISNTSACDGTIISETACGFVLEFEDIIETRVMNGEKTSIGGWPGSELYTYLNSTILNAMPEDLRNGIIYTTVVSSYGLGDTTGSLEDGNFISRDKLYLLSLREVYGLMNTNDKTSDETEQLDYYSSFFKMGQTNYSQSIKKMGENSTAWWFRTVNYNNINDSYFFVVGEDGKTSSVDANTYCGVSPAFRIG